ncbi:unnamed protein product [Arabis nemorensis]|uniref:Uncharacterized protein n=1 Tax=Arabis nemorensis TaxID=586526 RepID=A0A565BQU0_9BRAS|nr:unnamed protein product [Arabis nemorensis]
MFLLCDDIHTMLGFCFKLWRGVMPYRNPVLERLLLVIYNVYSKEIKPKNGVYQAGGSSVQWELIRTTWEEFADLVIVLHRLDMVLRRKVSSFEHRLVSSAIQKYKQDVLKKLEDKLRPANHVSKANGPLFDEEAISNETRSGILADLFTPLMAEPLDSKIWALPVPSPYILGKDFAMQELKQEVVQLGVELSLYVAQSMFLLCDDIRTMFYGDANNESHVMDRGGGTCGRELTSSIEEAVKKIEEKLWCVKAVSEENGFARDVIESKILHLWKSLFDKEAKEARLTLKEIKNGILRKLFGLLYNEAAAAL